MNSFMQITQTVTKDFSSAAATFLPRYSVILWGAGFTGAESKWEVVWSTEKI